MATAVASPKVTYSSLAALPGAVAVSTPSKLYSATAPTGPAPVVTPPVTYVATRALTALPVRSQSVFYTATAPPVLVPTRVMKVGGVLKLVRRYAANFTTPSP